MNDGCQTDTPLLISSSASVSESVTIFNHATLETRIYRGEVIQHIPDSSSSRTLKIPPVTTATTTWHELDSNNTGNEKPRRNRSMVATISLKVWDSVAVASDLERTWLWCGPVGG